MIVNTEVAIVPVARVSFKAGNSCRPVLSCSCWLWNCYFETVVTDLEIIACCRVEICKTVAELETLAVVNFPTGRVVVEVNVPVFIVSKVDFVIFGVESFSLSSFGILKSSVQGVLGILQVDVAEIVLAKLIVKNSLNVGRLRGRFSNIVIANIDDVAHGFRRVSLEQEQIGIVGIIRRKIGALRSIFIVPDLCTHNCS